MLNRGYLTLAIASGLCACATHAQASPSPTSIDLLLKYAQSLEGRPYRAGGQSPQTGFDCSGFVQHVYSRFDYALPRISRQQFSAGQPISKNALKAGDLVFFATSDAPKRITHVGIFLGAQEFIHAATRSAEVRRDNLNAPYYRSRFRGARRIAAPPKF